jgi:hypothetical protein
MTGKELIHNDTRFLLYQTEDGRIKIETRMQNETVWLTQDQMAELFSKAKSTIKDFIEFEKEIKLIEKDNRNNGK